MVGVGSYLAVLLSPILGNYNLEHLFEQIHLQFEICLRGGAQTGTGVDLNKPWLAIGIQQNIESVQLKAVLVVDNDSLHRLERHDDDVVDVLKTSVGFFGSKHHLHVESNAFDRPLAAMLVRVLFAILLNRDVGQMHKHVIHFGDVARIELVAEPPEALVVQIGFNWTIASYQHIDPQIKLLATD